MSPAWLIARIPLRVPKNSHNEQSDYSQRKTFPSEDGSVHISVFEMLQQAAGAFRSASGVNIIA